MNNFIPIKNSNWNDFMCWLKQSSPRHVVFMRATLNTLKNVCQGNLPKAQMDGKNLVMTWKEGGSTFKLSSKISLVHIEKSDLEWSIHDPNGKLMISGRAQDAAWWPESFVMDFLNERSRLTSRADLIFQLGFVSIVTVVILSSLFLI